MELKKSFPEKANHEQLAGNMSFEMMRLKGFNVSNRYKE
jgi:hypothetical protein